MTLAELVDEVTPRLRNPIAAAFMYWREHLGTLRTPAETELLRQRARDDAWALPIDLTRVRH